MKAIAKQLAAITFTALFLIALNVKAEGTETTTTVNEYTESAMEMENWMTDESIWNTNTSLLMEVAPEMETELGLEAWMTNGNSWNINFDIETETEKGMELENWMTSDSNWFVLPLENDSELQLEAWMINRKYWK